MAEDEYYREHALGLTFLLEVDGVEIGAFKEVHGLEVSIEVEHYAEGGQNGYVHHLPGRMTWPNLVFKRGITKADNFFSWLNEVSGPGFASSGHTLKRTTAAVTALALDRTRLRSWNVHGAFPVRWRGPDLVSGSTGRLDEELEVAHEGFTVETHV